MIAPPVVAAPAPEPVRSIAIGANKVAPQLPGTTATFTAAPNGGAAPHQYKWWIYEDGWKAVGSWTTSSTFTWTPAAANAGGRITVWVRSPGSSADEQEAAVAMDFVIAGNAVATPTPAPPVTAAPSARVSAVAIGANKVAPQPLGSTVTFTALPVGGAAPYQFKWWAYNGDAWIAMSPWTTANTFAWTSAMDFVITPFSATAPAVARLSGVTIAANLVAPQPPGSTVIFTATPAGGAAAQYKWWIYNGDAWVPVTGWTTASTFAWTPTSTNLGGRVTVWARSADSSADEAQATAAMDFVISGSR